MSSTNRHGLSRHKGDFYETPSWAVDVILNELNITSSFDGYIIDPGCGNGSIAHHVAARAPGADVTGVELDPVLLNEAKSKRAPSVAWECADWLTWSPDGTPDFIISNPPYQKTHWDPEKPLLKNGKPWLIDGVQKKGGIVVDDPALAENFIKKALLVAGKKATVAMLLRATYVCPAVRRELREAYGKPNIFFLETRPSFNGSGTDSADYAWHVWSPKSAGRWAVLRK